VGKPEGKRPLGRPRRRWVDNIRIIKYRRIRLAGHVARMRKKKKRMCYSWEIPREKKSHRYQMEKRVGWPNNRPGISDEENMCCLFRDFFSAYRPRARYLN
jgi:hypothetical protein